MRQLGSAVLFLMVLAPASIRAQDEEDEAPTKGKAAPEPEPPKKDDEPPAPPPGPPRPDEQEPRPYLGQPEPTSLVRHIELGPDVGLWWRPADSDRISYAPGLAWGAHARAPLLRYLAFRAYFNDATHAVEIPRGALGLPDTQVDQPDLEVVHVGARLEPTWPLTAVLELRAGLGVAWGRLTAPEPSSSGATRIYAAERSGVYLEYSGALGASYDVIPHWMTLSLDGSAGWLTSQSGQLFDSVQVVDQNGQTTSLEALPKLAGSYSVLLGVGIIL